ncbi:MAG TPA: CDP-diacylglycerol--glycerol-3-phosphate 3-phosphatidyltransferase [Steroidobacteraceae bacterium]|nr:CDP-diacylglycerol--glycerol-3-phosphate 3-phosphatidyltransferase [Steroidobacteraceae bacterium]
MGANLQSLPNILTIGRIVAVPLVVALFFWTSNPWADPLAAFVFIAAAITDSLDGYIARKLGITTPLGEFLDPVADKLMVATALVLLVWKDPHWVIALCAMIIVGREITVSALREWMAQLGSRAKVKVSSLGKWKTIVQMTGLSLMMYRNDLLGLPIYTLGKVLLVVASVLTLWSMVAYLRAAWPELRSDPLPTGATPPTVDNRNVSQG